ncbi:autotransporter-associated beta strand repeat-containing protein [Haloferula sp. BvORR071]|uniref:beta strand repeat-containing protein n=1 Tax=Haloferula sp. BvORR071 TaxID=1396141 RepID=UPI00054EDF9A|nr:autotransporter-associated beta strand repeat-containing protein [Haloferula sp. BvORR071]
MIYLHSSGGRTRAALLSAAASLAIASTSSAAVKTWDGGGSDDNTLTGPNWNADSAPAADDQLVLAGTLRPAPVNNYAPGTTFNGLSVTAGASAFTLSGNSLTFTRPITAGGVAVSGGTIVNNATTLLTISAPVSLSAGKQMITSPTGGGGINFTGAFSHSPNNSTVIARTGGHINFSAATGLANDASGILGGWAVIGDDWATINGSGNLVAYTGYTPIAAGAVANNPNANYRFTDETGDITAATGTTINTLQAKISAARNLNITGQMRLRPNGAIYRLGTSGTGVMGVQGTGSTLTVDGGGAMTLWDATTSAANFAATNNNLRIDSQITNDGASPVSVNIMGYLQMGSATAGANTYSGGTFINQGRVQAGNPATFGTGPVTIYAGGQAFTNSANIFANSFTVSGNGPTETNGGVNDGAGAIRLGTGSTISGTITLAGPTRLTTNSTGNGGSFTGRITGNGALQVGAFATTASIMNFNNQTASPNDWVGPLSVSALSNQRSFTLRLGAANQIPDTCDVTLSGATNATLELNGFNETIGALNGGVSNFLTVSNMAAGSTSTLTLGASNANGDFGGTIQDKVAAPTSTLNLVKTGTGKQVMRGSVNHSGTVSVNGGILEYVGASFGLGTITVNSGAALASNNLISGNVVLAGGSLRPTLVDFGQLSLGGNLTLDAGSSIDINTSGLPTAPVMVTGAITPTGGAGSVAINLTGAEPAVGQHQLITYNPTGSLGGIGAAAFTLGTKPPRMVANLVEDVPNKALLLNVTASGISAVWSGAAGSEWSTATIAAPKNWVLSNAPATTTDFLTNDAVVFNDNATGNTVDISVADVTPSAVLFDNASDNYTLTGSKGITGVAVLTKQNTGKLTINNPNSYSGGTLINAGTLELGNNGSLGSGTLHNEGVLAINRTVDSTFAPVIEGGGELHLDGSATTTLTGTNTYGGNTVISAGTARVTNNGSLGAGTVQVLAGGAVDIAGNTATTHNFGAKQFLISGNGPTGTGALVNSGTIAQLNAYQLVSLEADASVGGSGRFDIRGGTPVLDLNGHTLRKRGSNQFTLVAATLDDGGKVIVEQGLFALETTTTTNGSGSVVLEPGTMGGFYQNVPPVGGGVTWEYTLREGSMIGNAGTVLATIPAPIKLEGNGILTGFNASAPDPAAVRPLTLTGNITESGGSFGLAKNGVSIVTLTGAANSYTGATQVNGGTLVVDGVLSASPVTVASGATVGGIGTIGGGITASGTVSPALATTTGTLTAGATTLNSTGGLAVQINSAATTTDLLTVNGALTLGGTLTVTDIAPAAVALAVDTKFTIATYTGALSGAFSNAPEGAVLTVGLNKFKVDYDEILLGQTSVTLTVTAGSAYDEWATAKGLTAGNNGKNDDPDHDGLSNLLEFALDGSPLGGASDGKFRSAIADVDPGAGVDNAFTLTLPVRNGAVFTGPGDLVSAPTDNLVYSIQGSTTMASGDFTTLNVTEVTPALSSGLPALSTGWSYRSFRSPGSPNNPNTKAFLRLNVSESP